MDIIIGIVYKNFFFVYDEVILNICDVRMLKNNFKVRIIYILIIFMEWLDENFKGILISRIK